jgi:hypothetical protein
MRSQKCGKHAAEPNLPHPKLPHLLPNNIIHQSKSSFSMRYLLFFMVLVGIFVLGKRACTFSPFSIGGVRGEGPLKTETRNASGFHAIDFDIAGDIEISVADNYSIEVQAQENLLPLLKTEVNSDGRLVIYFSESVSYNQDLKIRVSGPAFDALSLSGSGNMRVNTPLNADRMQLSLGGSGNVFVPQGNFGALDCDISGSGSIEAGGKANSMSISLSGSGQVKAKGLATNELRTDVSGSGSVEATVLQTLKANISGSGNVRYAGTPTVESNVSGSGSVKPL